MNVHHGLRPVLTALLGGVLLNVSLPDPSCAGQDLRYLSFHPVPLAPASSASTETSSSAVTLVSLDVPAARASSSSFDPSAAARERAGSDENTSLTLRPVRTNAAARAEKYRERIAELRRSKGALALPLAEQLLALGRALQEQGQLDAALEAYEESRHLLRVNLGLNSLEQAPVLMAMFGTYAEQGDVGHAHAMQEALFNLRLRHHGGDGDGALNALLDWADWNVTLYLLLDPLPSLESTSHLSTRLNDPRLELAYASYTKALQKLQHEGIAGDPRLVTTERKLAALNFITDRKMLDTYGEALRVHAPVSDAAYGNTGNAFESASEARFHEGSSALRRALAYSERSAQRRDDDVAARMVELGDWYLLFDQRAAAMEMYRDALEFMRKASLPQEDVDRIMSPGMPVPTPDTAYLPPVEVGEYAGYIDVEFELTQFGMATKPKIIGRSEPNRPIERELLREIRSCKFRPKFVADAPVNREKIRLRYYYAL